MNLDQKALKKPKRFDFRFRQKQDAKISNRARTISNGHRGVSSNALVNRRAASERIRITDEKEKTDRTTWQVEDRDQEAAEFGVSYQRPTGLTAYSASIAEATERRSRRAARSSRVFLNIDGRTIHIEHGAKFTSTRVQKPSRC